MLKYEDLLLRTTPYRVAALLILALILLASGGCSTRIVSSCNIDLSKVSIIRVTPPKGKSANIGEHQKMCVKLVRDVRKGNELKRSFLEDATQ